MTAAPSASSSIRDWPGPPAQPWSVDGSALLEALRSSPQGLAAAEAARRLVICGANRLRPARRITALRTFAAQFKSPLVLILVFAAVISLATREYVDASIVLAIIAISATLTFAQEYRAGRAIEALLARVAPRASVLRDGQACEIAAAEVVPGDVVVLAAGDLVPADARVLRAQDFFVNEAVLTGETFPTEKSVDAAAPEATLPQRTCCVFMGSNVRSGSAHALVYATGAATEFGAVENRLALRAPRTEFEAGIARFGQLLTQVMLLLVLVIFAGNVAADRSVVQSLLFAVAIAVGLAPELLPAIIGLLLARGARRLARHGVLVRRLAAIENLGSMDILATDKTGTLTTGEVRWHGALDPQGRDSGRLRDLAYLNASLQTGLVNPLDGAITAAGPRKVAAFHKTEEIPYDFLRKRMTIAVREGDGADDDLLITKGALGQVLAACDRVRVDSGTAALDGLQRAALDELAGRHQADGIRVLGVATREVPPRSRYTADDETSMVFEGFLLFLDPAKPDAGHAIRQLRRLGIQLKIITGDSCAVALWVAHEVGLEVEGVLSGAQIADMHDEALWQSAERTTIFAEVDPNQKEKIVSALRRTGHVVGYLGDGINDAPALHMADVGISVDNAVDVAKQTADFVLLKHSLTMLHAGIEEGRRVFANTLKYVYMTTSANFGNMVSMAAVSLLLPFLPLLPKQILLNNFLSDLPAMAMVGDRVDRDWIVRPHRWTLRRVRNFMLVFGLISSAFDLLTFALLWWLVQAAQDAFRTAWFVESLLTEVVILLIVRTRGPALRNPPSRALALTTAIVGVLAIALPYVPAVARWFDFVPLPAELMLLLIAITVAYALANELAKRAYFRRHAQ